LQFLFIVFVRVAGSFYRFCRILARIVNDTKTINNRLNVGLNFLSHIKT